MITLKEILTEVEERNFQTPGGVYASSAKPQHRRLVSFANMACRDLIKAHDWSFLKEQGTITVVDGTTLYAKPDNFYRMIPDTFYRNGSYFRIDFPANDQAIEYRKAHNVGQVYEGRFYQGQFELINLPPGDLSYLYIKDEFVQSDADDSYSIKFTDDNDTFLPDIDNLDELIVLATEAIYLERKQDSGAVSARAQYQSELDEQIANDIGSRSLNDLEDKHSRRTLWRHNPNYGS